MPDIGGDVNDVHAGVLFTDSLVDPQSSARFVE
jgi:hypothetical protein